VPVVALPEGGCSVGPEIEPEGVGCSNVDLGHRLSLQRIKFSLDRRLIVVICKTSNSASELLVFLPMQLIADRIDDKSSRVPSFHNLGHEL
jgi:hypothetical protein